MAGSILDRLSPLARALFGVIQRGVSEGLSIRAIGRALREGGATISNDILSEVVRRERGLQEFGSRIDELPRGRLIDPDSLPEALTALRRQFSFTVELTGTDARGREVVQHVTVTSDRSLTPERIEELAEDLGTRGAKAYGLRSIDEITIVRGVRAGRAGLL